MTQAPPVGAFAIVPTDDLAASIAFWEQMGFTRTGGEPAYVIMTGWDCEVHLRPGDPPPWDVPENNPFGIFIRTPQVAEIAARMDDLVIRRRHTAAPRMGSLRGRHCRARQPAGPGRLAFASNPRGKLSAATAVT